MKNSNSRIPVQTVSNSAPKIPWFILKAGKFLQFFSGHLAMRYALKIFRTPIKYPIPEREQMMDSSAQSEFLMIPSLNKKVKVYIYGYSKKKALMVHGWSGRGTQLYAIADKLLENGFMTISFDGPAHGQSSGKTTMMPEFMETCLEIDKKYGPFEIGIGHSLGGMTLVNAARKGLPVNKIVTIGAGDKISDIVHAFIELLQLKPKIAHKISNYYSKIFSVHINTYATSNAAKEVEIPVLVIHDSQDKEIPVSCAYRIRQNLKSGQLLITNGLGHKRILYNSQTIKRIVDFATG